MGKVAVAVVRLVTIDVVNVFSLWNHAELILGCLPVDGDPCPRPRILVLLIALRVGSFS